jgi:hypothetical protein
MCMGAITKAISLHVENVILGEMLKYHTIQVAKLDPVASKVWRASYVPTGKSVEYFD